MFCWPCILVWPLQITNLTYNFSSMFISILYMFRAAMCPSSRELLYQCDNWFMSLCVDDRLVRIPDGHLQTIIPWWWSHGCPKHVENGNKHKRKNCESSWLFTRINVSTLLSIVRQTFLRFVMKHNIFKSHYIDTTVGEASEVTVIVYWHLWSKAEARRWVPYRYWISTLRMSHFIGFSTVKTSFSVWKYFILFIKPCS